MPGQRGSSIDVEVLRSARLIALIEPYYPKGEVGRPSYPLTALLRCCAAPDAELVRLQRTSNGGSAVRNHYPAPVCRAEPGSIPDETTILNFRCLLEKHEAVGILAVINGYLGDRGCRCAKAESLMQR